MVVVYGVHFFSCSFRILLKEKGVRLVVKVRLEIGREGGWSKPRGEGKEEEQTKIQSRKGKEEIYQNDRDESCKRRVNENVSACLHVGVYFYVYLYV